MRLRKGSATTATAAIQTATPERGATLPAPPNGGRRAKSGVLRRPAQVSCIQPLCRPLCVYHPHVSVGLSPSLPLSLKMADHRTKKKITPFWMCARLLSVCCNPHHVYDQVATGTKCSLSDSSKRAMCSNGNAGNCGPMTLAQCTDECINAGDCTHVSHLDPSGSDTCIICREFPDERGALYSRSTTYSVSAGTP